MKKFIVLIFALLLLFSFSACSEMAESFVSEYVSAMDENEKIAETSENETSSSKTMGSEAEEAAVSIVFEEITVIDDENCLIKITGIEENDILGYTLNAYFENRSTEITYMFSVNSASVNGVDADPFFATEVAPGKKSNEQISFSDSSFNGNDIGEFSDIELNFRVSDSNDWMADPVAEPAVHIYPMGEESASAFVREPAVSDILLVDNENLTAVITGFRNDSLWGYSADVFFVNKTDVPVMFSIDEASVNGFMADPLFATEVKAGKCAFSSISWFDTTLEENGITEVENIEFTLRASNNDDWLADPFIEEVFTIEP